MKAPFLIMYDLIWSCCILSIVTYILKILYTFDSIHVIWIFMKVMKMHLIILKERATNVLEWETFAGHIHVRIYGGDERGRLWQRNPIWFSFDLCFALAEYYLCHESISSSVANAQKESRKTPYQNQYGLANMMLCQNINACLGKPSYCA